MRLDTQQLQSVIAVPLPHHRPRYYWFPSPRGYRSFPHNPPPRLRAKIDTGIRTGRVDKKLFVEAKNILQKFVSGRLYLVFERYSATRSGIQDREPTISTRIEKNFGLRLLAGYRNWPPNVRKIGARKEAYANDVNISLFRLFRATKRRISNSIRADRILNVISKVICFGKRDSARDNVRWMERRRQSRSWLVALAYR